MVGEIGGRGPVLCALRKSSFHQEACSSTYAHISLHLLLLENKLMKSCIPFWTAANGRNGDVSVPRGSWICSPEFLLAAGRFRCSRPQESTTPPSLHLAGAGSSPFAHHGCSWKREPERRPPSSSSYRGAPRGGLCEPGSVIPMKPEAQPRHRLHFQ